MGTKKRNQCSKPWAVHLLIENLDHYGLGVNPQAEWVHAPADREPKPGDILEVCAEGQPR